MLTTGRMRVKCVHVRAGIHAERGEMVKHHRDSCRSPFLEMRAIALLVAAIGLPAVRASYYAAISGDQAAAAVRGWLRRTRRLSGLSWAARSRMLRRFATAWTRHTMWSTCNPRGS